MILRLTSYGPTIYLDILFNGRPPDLVRSRPAVAGVLEAAAAASSVARARAAAAAVVALAAVAAAAAAAAIACPAPGAWAAGGSARPEPLRSGL